VPRFAILEHDHPILHWDLLLEHGPACRTWRLATPLDGDETIAAEELPDHRLLYLDYAGPVGGNRGKVTQWDAGSFIWPTATENCVAVLIAGNRWSGRLELQRIQEGWQVNLSPR